jgi:CubicO group peptidase (beta-lactamase class C family)
MPARGGAGPGRRCIDGGTAGSATSATRLARVVVVLLLALLAACGSRPSTRELQSADYRPGYGGDWAVSTPAEQGLEPMAVATMYVHAGELESLRSLLVIRHGKLVAEGYFNGGATDRRDSIASVTKSYTSALVGIALREGCIASVDQPMMDFFPELSGRITDSRKFKITIRQMLQMRAGYPWEESSAELFELMYSGFRTSSLVDVPLARDPGSGMEYSNLTAHLLGVIVARACRTDLRSFAIEHLLEPLGSDIGEWVIGWEGYYLGFADLQMSARDLGRFGLLYLDNGRHDGQQIVSATWVADSLRVSSTDAWPFRVGRNFQDISYGYQWWAIRAGGHTYNLAWGHGGQQIAVVHDLDLVVVATADPLFGQHGDGPWRLERANLNLVADFIASLPASPSG